MCGNIILSKYGRRESPFQFAEQGLHGFISAAAVIKDKLLEPGQGWAHSQWRGFPWRRNGHHAGYLWTRFPLLQINTVFDKHIRNVVKAQHFKTAGEHAVIKRTEPLFVGVAPEVDLFEQIFQSNDFIN